MTGEKPTNGATSKVMELPLPTSKNPWQRQHWAKRSRTKKAWQQIVWAWVNTPPRMPRPLERVRCSIEVVWDKRGPLPDPHNLEMAVECVADGLVEAGIIEDDASGRFIREDVTLRRALPREKGRSIVTLKWSSD